MKEEILAVLKEKKKYVSGQELGDLLGVSRTYIWKQVQILRKEGCDIVARPRRGYFLTYSPDSLRQGELKPLFKGELFKGPLYYFEKTNSTNVIARDLARRGTPEGTIVTAETQVKGKGRLSRRWLSPVGGIWLSFVIYPPVSPLQVPLFTFLTAVALVEALAEEGLETGIKWPNDVLYQGRKIAGILTEMGAEGERVSYLVIGVGINANISLLSLTPEVRQKASSLLTILGRPVDRPALAAAFLARFSHYYYLALEEGFDRIIKLWHRYEITLGRKVLLQQGDKKIEGIASGINDSGSLILTLPDGRQETYLAGEVTLL
ncbi:MAG TPA: biotin--[acetyl-CoA-carboxylase] ligase [Firmicutes bacterium]|nr:biotin--[acetyl-CoA-carboxylase] ligase [Bacillota bacterium]